MHLRLSLHLELVSAQCCNMVPSLRQDIRAHHIPMCPETGASHG